MEIKKVWSVWFSGTGTTQKVATALSKQVAEGLQAQWEEYSFNLPAAREKELSFGPADLVVLGVPVFAMFYSVVSRLVNRGLKKRGLPLETVEYMGKTGALAPKQGAAEQDEIAE